MFEEGRPKAEAALGDSGPIFSAGTILDALPIIAFTAANSGEVTFINRDLDDRSEHSAAASLGTGWRATIHPDDLERIENLWAETIAAGLPYEAELRCRVAEGVYPWFLCRAAPIRNESGEILGYAGTLLDIDAQKTAESRLRNTIELFERATARERLYSQISERLSIALSLNETIEVLLDAIVPEFADWMSVYLQDRETSEFHVVGMRHWDERRRPIVERLMGAVFTSDESATAAVLRTGKPMLIRSYPETLRSRSIKSQNFDDVQMLGLRSAIVVPFSHEGRVIGAIHVIRGDNPQEFGEADLLLAEELARRMTPAIYSAEVHERERLVARSFQEAALPLTLPKAPNFEFDAVYRAARTEATVGGDWYDVFPLDGDRFLISVGDVGGHGLAAATTMAMLRQSLRALSLTTSSPGDLMFLLRSVMAQERPEALATAFIGIISQMGRLQYVSAGHPAPLLRHTDGTVEELTQARRAVLGFPIQKPREIGEATIPDGALLVLYTDGLIEATRNIQEGEAALRNLVASPEVGNAPYPAQLIYAKMLPSGTFDDTAILTLRYSRPTSRPD